MNQSVSRVPRASLPLLLAMAGWAGMIGGCGSGVAPISGDIPPNFHTVDPGRLYRSAQPTEGDLANIVSQLGIRTVVNLRGENAGKPWYDEEERACRELGVTLINHRMSAGGLPPVELLAQIIATLQSAEYPMLVHCQGGADRTGAVSAIYRMLVLGDSRDNALSELSPYYLHFRFATPCMDTLAELFEPTAVWLDWYAANADRISCTPNGRVGPVGGDEEE